MTSLATTVPPERSGSGRRRLFLLLAWLPVLLAILNSNTHAVHAGMSAEHAAHAVQVAAGDHGREAPPAGRAAVVAASEDALPSVPVLHVLGACLAVLMAAAILLLGARGSSSPSPAWRAAWRVRGRPLPRWAWRPPPLGPPVLSPVMRS